MADKITTLHPENDTSINLYPNVKDENIPNTIARVSYVDQGDNENDLAISAVRADLDTEIADRKKDTSDTNGRIDGLATDISILDTRITGLHDAVTGVNNELLEEVTNRENADTALSNRIATNETNIVSNTNAIQVEATTRNNQITGLRDVVTGINNELQEEVTNRENADNAMTTALGNKADFKELGNIWSLPTGATWRIRLQHSVKIGKMVFTHLILSTADAIPNGNTTLAILNTSLVTPNAAHLFPFADSSNAIKIGQFSNWGNTGQWHLASYNPINANSTFVDFELFFSTVS